MNLQESPLLIMLPKVASNLASILSPVVKSPIVVAVLTPKCTGASSTTEDYFSFQKSDYDCFSTPPIDIPASKKKPVLSISTMTVPVEQRPQLFLNDNIDILQASSAVGVRTEESYGNEPLKDLRAWLYHRNFPRDHFLDTNFVKEYTINGELGTGGYGFVLRAVCLADQRDVAVKFILKSSVPIGSWIDDGYGASLPIEIYLLGSMDHPNIIRALDLFEDDLYYYLVMELHGSDWLAKSETTFDELNSFMPPLSPSDSVDSVPSPMILTPTDSFTHFPQSENESCKPPFLAPTRPALLKRNSHDLFELLESTTSKSLSESNARYVMAQVVDAVAYLHSMGIVHRDIKDENIVIDDQFQVKMIDFGSAAVSNPDGPQPLYDLFFGTATYASPEIKMKMKHLAKPAEIWTLGMLLSYLLTGMSPFKDDNDWLLGRVDLSPLQEDELSSSALHLIKRCLDPSPLTRADILEVKGHPWFTVSL